MITRVVVHLLYFVFLPSSGNIHLAAKDGFEWLFAPFFSLLINFIAIIRELFDSEHYTMVSDSHSLHAVFNSLIDQILHF